MEKIKIKWSKKDKDFLIYYPSSPTGSFISELLKPWKMIHPTGLVNESWTTAGYKKVDCYEGSLGEYSLLEMDWLKELERRGYDLTTLKFEISKKEGVKK